MATQRNYAQQMDAVLATLGDTRPRLLLHACCGPCSSAVLEQLCRYFEITVLYYNPNTWPAAEYYRRGEELQKFVAAAHPLGVTVVEDSYDPQQFYTAVAGLENEPERGSRCTGFRYRLRCPSARPANRDKVVVQCCLELRKRSGLRPAAFDGTANRRGLTDFANRGIGVSKRTILHRRFCFARSLTQENQKSASDFDALEPRKGLLTYLQSRGLRRKKADSPIRREIFNRFPAPSLWPLSRCATAPPGAGTPAKLHFGQKLFRHAKASPL